MTVSPAPRPRGAPPKGDKKKTGAEFTLSPDQQKQLQAESDRRKAAGQKAWSKSAILGELIQGHLPK